MKLARRFMLACAVGLTMVLVGCKMSPSQIAATSQSAGTAVTIVWIAYDNPSVAQKEGLSLVLSTVRTNIGIVGTNTYVSVLYPKVQAYVDASTNIPAIDKPLIDAGALAILGGIDMLFAGHPDWKKDTQQVGVYVGAFITGANIALALPENDPQIVSAIACHKTRLGIKR